MSGWNIANVLETVAATVPDQPAVIQGDRTVIWGELDRHAERVAKYLVASGLPVGGKVAQYMRNCPEYLESLYAALKCGATPVNTNYRYGADELTYLWDNADVNVVVFHGEFTPLLETVRARVPRVRQWLWVDDGSSPRPDWAADYAEVAADPSTDADAIGRARSGDDLLLLYTGGTTGLPKGVMWRQDDLFVLTGNAANGRYGDLEDLAYARSRVSAPGRRMLPAAPLMHGAGCFSCVPILARGGAVVLLEGKSFEAAELLDAVERQGVHSVSWVGDAFARPVADALDAEPDRWDLSSLRAITSGGVVFTREVKLRILAHASQALINDVFGASEAITVGSSVTSASSGPAPTGTFTPRDTMRVITEDGRDVVPGSGERGLIAFSGRQPLGYYKDPEKSATVFRILDGRRHSVPGDWATVAADGTATLLGRGSACINTGGEKVFPDEVETAILELDAVQDAVVVGVPDDRFGQSVAAVVQLRPDGALDAPQVIEHVKSRIAHYKAPRRVLFVDSMERGPNGKADLRRLRERVVTDLAPADLVP